MNFNFTEKEKEEILKAINLLENMFPHEWNFGKKLTIYADNIIENDDGELEFLEE